MKWCLIATIEVTQKWFILWCHDRRCVKTHASTNSPLPLSPTSFPSLWFDSILVVVGGMQHRHQDSSHRFFLFCFPFSAALFSFLSPSLSHQSTWYSMDIPCCFGFFLQQHRTEPLSILPPSSFPASLPFHLPSFFSFFLLTPNGNQCSSCSMFTDKCCKKRFSSDWVCSIKSPKRVSK